MEIRRRHLYVIDFNPRVRTKPGKLRPAVVLQSDIVSEAGYPSTIVIPTTTRLVKEPGFLRLRIQKGEAGSRRKAIFCWVSSSPLPTSPSAAKLASCRIT